MIYFRFLCAFLQFPGFLRTSMFLIIRSPTHSAIISISVNQRGGISVGRGSLSLQSSESLAGHLPGKQGGYSSSTWRQGGALPVASEPLASLGKVFPDWGLSPSPGMAPLLCTRVGQEEDYYPCSLGNLSSCSAHRN